MMLEDDILMPDESPFAYPVVLYRKNDGKSVDGPEAWKFAIDYRK